MVRQLREGYEERWVDCSGHSFNCSSGTRALEPIAIERQAIAAVYKQMPSELGCLATVFRKSSLYLRPISYLSKTLRRQVQKTCVILRPVFYCYKTLRRQAQKTCARSFFKPNSAWGNHISSVAWAACGVLRRVLRQIAPHKALPVYKAFPHLADVYLKALSLPVGYVFARLSPIILVYTWGAFAPFGICSCKAFADHTDVYSRRLDVRAKELKTMYCTVISCILLAKRMNK